MARYLNNEELLVLPQTTMLGALTSYISCPEHTSFQPINSNWGIIAPMEMDRKTRKDKKLKNQLYSRRAIDEIKKIKI